MRTTPPPTGTGVAHLDHPAHLDELGALVPMLMGMDEAHVRAAFAARMPWFRPDDELVAAISSGRRRVVLEM